MLKAMALAATHIRFALELRDALAVTDLSKYLSGTMYPDSRAYTGVRREVTHDSALFARDLLLLNDFEKGWAMHLRCDLIQGRAMEILFPDELAESIVQDDEWMFRTALKLLQSLDDSSTYDAPQFARMMTHVETPNGEPYEKVRSFYAFVADIFEHTPLTILSEVSLWEKTGMKEKLIQAIIVRTEALASDASAMRRVKQLYSLMRESEDWGVVTRL